MNIKLKKEIVDLITMASKSIGKPMVEGVDFEIVYQPLKHKYKVLPDGKIAVYTFYYKNQFLKIGQANIKSKARYQSHHYHIKSGKSTLANSILQDNSMKSIIGENNITQWICDNCERYDVVIDGTRHDKMALNFVEGLLHYYYRPKYESKK